MNPQTMQHLEPLPSDEIARLQRECDMRREDHMAACQRIDRRDAEIARLKAKLRDRDWRIKIAARLLHGSIRRDVLDVLNLRKPLPKRGAKP